MIQLDVDYQGEEDAGSVLGEGEWIIQIYESRESLLIIDICCRLCTYSRCLGKTSLSIH